MRNGALKQLSLVLVVLALATRLAAHEGHDHDKPPPLALPIAPRVTAVTPDFELVGVLSGKTRLTVFLTSFATNEPVKDAKIVVENGDQKVEAISKGDGVFDVAAPWLAGEGGLDLVFNLTLPNGADLLTGRLERSVPATATATEREPGSAWYDILTNPIGLMLGAGGLILGALATLLFSPRTRSIVSEEPSPPAWDADVETTPSPKPEDGIKVIRRAALTALLTVAIFSETPWAQAADVAAPASPTVPSTMATDLPQRLADGSLFVPKATQHLLSVRTMLTAEADATLAVELPGTVVAGPNNFGRVQAGHSGRLASPPDGLPYVGKQVEKGDVLGYLEPHIGTVERGTLESQIAEVDARIEAQKIRIARLRGAPLAVPLIKVEESEGELKALQERRRQLNPMLTQRHEILAPLSGIVSKAGYFAGQVIEPRDVLFEIVNPSEFWVEGIAYGDTALEAQGSASGIVGSGQQLKLHYIGRGLTLKEQATTLMFRINEGGESVSIGQPVRVLVKSKKKISGFVVPSSSIVRGPSGLPIVWVKTEAERFEPQTVKTEPLDGQSVVVTAGLKPDVRVVTEGVTLLNQVR